MQEGDLFLIPGSTVHRALPDAGNPVTSSALFFSPSYLLQLPEACPPPLLHPFERCRKRRIYKGILILPSEYKSLASLMISIPSSVRMIILVLTPHCFDCSFAYFLERLESATGPAHATASLLAPSWLSSILSDIDHKLHSRLTLPELAKQAAVSPAHLSRAFKRYTGMTLTDYVLARRVIMAKEHLLDGDETMAAVADACGFDSLPHFTGSSRN